ncbi:MAG: EAL domain-containing protein [Actinomycetota bacterium]|nr:EAL domain-containing protein [Actinomycetota bacterium]
MSAVVVGLGLALSTFAWVGLRQVESSQAKVSYDRLLLSQGTELQGKILGYLDGMDQLSSSLSEAGLLPSVTAMENRGISEGALDSLGAIDAFAVVEGIPDEVVEASIRAREESYGHAAFLARFSPDPSTRPNVVLSRASGLDGAAGRLGEVVRHQALDQLYDDVVTSEKTVAGASDVASHIFSALNGPAAPVGARLDVVLATPVSSPTGETAGVLLARLDLAKLFAEMQSISDGDVVALQVLADDIALFTALAGDALGSPFGEPVTFSEGAVRWSIQGFDAGLEVDHRGSWVALITGVLLALTGGIFTMATRRHAITLGRLERSQFDARHDPLTGLLNRAGLTDELEHILERREPSEVVAVLFLDMDRLKVVNDSMGHSAGDEVLNHVGQRLQSITRDQDIVGRFGGDEFVMVTRGLSNEADVAPVATRILETLRRPAVLSDESTQMVSGSIGISFVTGTDEATAESLLRDADLAMYRAKDAGGSCFEVFDSELRAQALARLEIDRELRRAIRTGQLVVHYQPIVDVQTGRVDRFEALVRWQHPVRGMIPPGQFLSVAAESGLIVDLGEHVLRESCRQVALWSTATGRKIRVSVNVAERQLIDSSLVATVKRVLAESGVEPEQLELEITEDLLVDRMGSHLKVLRELAAMGIKLAIDDFGTSRASLGQLKTLDMVSTLKIDRAFVIDVATDSVDRKIITAIVALAESVGMEVVVEGVEYADQVSALRQLGVDLIQGFYFQRPGPAEKAVSLLTKTFAVPEPADFDAPAPA